MVAVTGSKRTFVAVTLDDDVRSEISELIGLLSLTGADVKWVEEKNLHMTLRFLGETPPDTLPAVSRALSRVLGAAESLAFSMRIAGVGAYPSLTSPRVIWAGVSEGRECLTGVASMVNEALAEAGLTPERRSFSPHLTLGRCRSKRNLDELKKAMVKLQDYVGPRVCVKRVVLYSSVLHPTGPVYAPLSTFELQVGGPK